MNNPLTIVLLGNTGVGKSATGNTILGRDAFESRRAFMSVTTEISKETRIWCEKRISVIDTPGILCDGSEEKCRRCCQELLQSSTPCLFLVVVKIDRFSQEQKEAVEAAIRVIGDQGMKNSLLLFTRGDDLNDMSVDDFIKQEPNGPLPPYVERFGRKYHVFNNTSRGQEQVEDLLEKWSHLQTSEPGSPPRETYIISNDLEERRIVLLGLTGAGKSSSGNTILGAEIFPASGGFKPKTLQCLSASAELEGRQVTVVDTPGINEEFLMPKQLYEEILKVVPKGSPGPHAFVIVVRISIMSKADFILLEHLPKIFGSDAHKYTMVLFTAGDELKDQSIDEMIEEADGRASALVSMCGHRYCVFDNNQKGNRRQVKNLLNKIDEMVTANGGGPYSLPKGWIERGLETFIMVLEEIKKYLSLFLQSNQMTAVRDYFRPSCSSHSTD